jgi:hypothetical protein
MNLSDPKLIRKTLLLISFMFHWSIISEWENSLVIIVKFCNSLYVTDVSLIYGAHLCY